MCENYKDNLTGWEEKKLIKEVLNYEEENEKVGRLLAFFI